MTSPTYPISFLNKEHAFIPQPRVRCKDTSPFSRICTENGLDELIFLHQTHGTAGAVITQENISTYTSAFTQPGDFLITQMNNIGIAVATADCLPIIYVDQVQSIIGIAHAGWRGAVAGIAEKVVEILGTHGSKKGDIQAFFGPCAHVCCYTVQEDFIAHIQEPYTSTIVTRNGTTYFDLVAYTRLRLERIGISVDTSASVCTIHTATYCSVRTHPGSKLRQMSYISLKHW